MVSITILHFSQRFVRTYDGHFDVLFSVVEKGEDKGSMFTLATPKNDKSCPPLLLLRRKTEHVDMSSNFETLIDCRIMIE